MKKINLIIDSYISGWIDLDFTKLCEFLDQDTVYESQYVFSSIVGKQAIAKHLNGKAKAIKGTRSTLLIEKATCRRSNAPVVVLTQQIDEQVNKAIIQFTVEADKLKSFILCIAGLYPSKDIDPQVTLIFMGNSLSKE